MPDLPVSASGKTAAEVARLCAAEAGRIILAAFGPQHEVQVKGRGNVLTDADLQAEHAVLDILRQEFPDHAVLSEETAAHARSEGWMWVVDPLDGTHNYSRGIPYFCFNIALCRQGEPVLGLTSDPVRGAEFFAVKGGGATLNGAPVRVSTVGSVAEAVVGADLGYEDARAARLLTLIHELWPGMQSVRIMGSAALGLAYAACGRYDLFVHHYLFPWDVAAGILLVREAGGAVVGRDGGAASIYGQGVVAGAPKVVDDFLRLAKGKPWRD
ncbi:MAG: inositol monophosphatase [Chloroflexi bacterium]|nr:inositol monophosphatase [Chloroflexota bacterium]